MSCLHKICNGWESIKTPDDVATIFDCLLERKALVVNASGRFRRGNSNATIRGVDTYRPPQ